MNPVELIERKRAERDAQDLAWLLSDARGRRFVWRLIADAGMFRSISPSRTERESAFNEGARNTALRLWGEIGETCHDRLLMMQSEAAETAMREQAELRALQMEARKVDDGN